jgi:ferric-dicitrate binding protein FerR (iron transport regulator)
LGETVATIERSTIPTLLSPHDTVRTGQWLDTDETGRVALRLTDRTSVRLDTRTRARLLSSTIIELTGGALYVDAGRDSTGLEVRTPLGTAYDIGTQFEIRLRDSSLQLRVRTGLVELRRGDRSISARPGTELDVAAGAVVSRTVSAYGPEWEWAASLAPLFEIEGRPLSAFLEHLSREHGWTLRYADATLAHEVSGIILHGSVNGLQPREALAVALTTSGLHHRFQDGEVFVSRTANTP